MPKEGSHYICLSIRLDKNYYPQVFLEECKYIVTEKQMKRWVKDYLESSYHEEISDKE